MPTYNFLNKETNKEFSEFMSMSSLDEYLKNNPNLSQIVSSPVIISGRGMNKPDDSFRDILRNIKHEHSRGTTSATVNTF